MERDAINSWAMVSACWFKTEVRHRILNVMLNTFGRCAGHNTPLYVIDGSPETIARKNKQLTQGREDIHYIYDPIEMGIDRMLNALRKIPYEYIVTICDDFVLVGDNNAFLRDVESSVRHLKKNDAIDAFVFYCAQLHDFQEKNLKFVQPILKPEFDLSGERARLSVCPRFFYNLGVHRRDRLIESLEYLKKKELRTFRGAELNTLPNRVWAKVGKMEIVQKVLWKVLNASLIRNFRGGLYRTIVLRSQESAFYHLGELESSVLDGYVRSDQARDILLNELMRNDDFATLLQNADIEETGLLVHC